MERRSPDRPTCDTMPIWRSALQPHMCYLISQSPNKAMSDALHTRDRIIEAARDLFLTQGYNSTGLAQITQRAGVKSGSLYYFFPTKEDLLVAVLDFYRANIYDGL